MFLHMEEPSELVDQCFHLYHIQIELQNRLVAQSVKNLLEIQETGVQSLGREDPPLHKSREPRVSCLNPGKPSRDLLQHVSRPDSPTMAREQ